MTISKKYWVNKILIPFNKHDYIVQGNCIVLFASKLQNVLQKLVNVLQGMPEGRKGPFLAVKVNMYHLLTVTSNYILLEYSVSQAWKPVVIPLQQCSESELHHSKQHILISTNDPI
jgi:hypothetical protein